MFYNMVQGVINIGEEQDRVLNIVKAQNSLKNKSQAIELIINIYADSFLEPELRESFIKKLEKIETQKGKKFKSMGELRKSIES